MFTFTVDAVTHSSLVYNSGQNLQTEGSISILAKTTQIQTGSIPGEFQLLQNHPNPFNPETTIQFLLPKSSHVDITIYNMLGKVIRLLVSKEYSAGEHTLKWDGRDRGGNPVSSGAYLYQINAGAFTQVKKMSLLR